mmetsp:Transcript_5836/g.14846  ORF Transcript_5836/g.14846 Transcript_5836/m.14846 type:complete len:89 (+) Transcript_5836:90-356(+)
MRTSISGRDPPAPPQLRLSQAQLRELAFPSSGRVHDGALCGSRKRWTGAGADRMGQCLDVQINKFFGYACASEYSHSSIPLVQPHQPS